MTLKLVSWKFSGAFFWVEQLFGSFSVQFLSSWMMFWRCLLGLKYIQWEKKTESNHVISSINTKRSQMGYYSPKFLYVVKVDYNLLGLRKVLKENCYWLHLFPTKHHLICTSFIHFSNKSLWQRQAILFVCLFLVISFIWALLKKIDTISDFILQCIYFYIIPILEMRRTEA